MTLEVKVYDNGDHTCIVWKPDDEKPIPGCLGFVVRKIRAGKTDYLHGAVGFSALDTFDPTAPWKFPVQRFMWWDYFVQPGDKVVYQVLPVTGGVTNPVLDELNASKQTDELTITGQRDTHISAFFNKGIVASQWVSRELDALKAKVSSADAKSISIKDVVKDPAQPLRQKLSGLLRREILKQLKDTLDGGGEIYGALYELNDPELIPALTALGKRCHLILANGAFKPGEDENKDVREQIRPTVDLHDRMVTSGHFGHNKFVVFCDSAGNPKSVLTGSTNWTSSGLCTQANNALIIDDATVAADYLAAWNRIKVAGNDYTDMLIDGNSTLSEHAVDGHTVTPWFVVTSDAQDLEYARKLIHAAEEGILFLFFNPGVFQDVPKKWTLLQNILERHNPDFSEGFNAGLYLCGVVNQDIPQLTKPGDPSHGAGGTASTLDPSQPNNPVTLFKSGLNPPLRLSHDVLIPHNIKAAFGQWEQELLGASMVNIHSKVIVLDPFGKSPVVMTGSHNLGFKASSKNDDNLVIIQGSNALAIAYAINIIAIFQNYRWNSYVEAHRADPNVWHGPRPDDKWQSGYLSGDHLKELDFWLGQSAVMPAGVSGVATT